MSGGVGSAVAAARALAAGHDVVGISLRLAAGGGSCCSLDDFHDARAVADRLGFPHYVFDLADDFERHVVRPFVAEYVAGRTPNPCARCNRHLKLASSGSAPARSAPAGSRPATTRASAPTRRPAARTCGPPSTRPRTRP